MKKLIITFMIILVAWGWTMPLRAQTNDLSSEELEMFRTEVKTERTVSKCTLRLSGARKTT